MGEKVDRLVELARVYVPAHVAVVGGKTIHVAAYTRTVAPGFRSSVAAGGGGTYGEGGMGPARRIEVTADEDNMGRPKVSGPVLSWTQDDGVEFERGVAYTWDMGGVTYTGTFSGIHGGGPGVANDRAIMRDVDATYADGATKTHEQFYAPRSGVRSLEDVDREVREAAYKQDISPVEYLRSKVEPPPGASGFPEGSDVTISTPGSGLHPQAKVLRSLPNGKVEVRMSTGGEIRIVDARNLQHGLK